MKSLFSKTGAQEKIAEFFAHVQGKTPKEIQKIKRLAQHYHVSLRPYKKLFCKKCFVVFDVGNSEIRINKGMKIVRCKTCGTVMRYGLHRNQA